MKYFLVSILTTVIFSFTAFSYSEKQLTSQLYSYEVESIAVKKYTVSINYIPIEKNIDRKDTSLEEYITFARNTSSHIFYIKKKSDTLFAISYIQKNDGSKTSFYYDIKDVKRNARDTIKSSVWGEITEKRVDEMIKKSFDPKSKKGAIVGMNSRQFLFNDMIYGYQDYEELKIEVIELTKLLIKK